MATPGIGQSSAGLQNVASTTDSATQSVNQARLQMQNFINDFASRSQGHFVDATQAASLRISDLFAKIETRLTKYAGDSRALDADIQATNALHAGKMGTVANG